MMSLSTPLCLPVMSSRPLCCWVWSVDSDASPEREKSLELIRYLVPDVFNGALVDSLSGHALSAAGLAASFLLEAQERAQLPAPPISICSVIKAQKPGWLLTSNPVSCCWKPVFYIRRGQPQKCDEAVVKIILNLCRLTTRLFFWLMDLVFIYLSETYLFINVRVDPLKSIWHPHVLLISKRRGKWWMSWPDIKSRDSCVRILLNWRRFP